MIPVNIVVADDVKEYVSSVASALEGLFDVYLVGGYLRDSYTGFCEPKDVDIILIPQAGGLTEVPLSAVVGTYPSYLHNVEAGSDMDKRGVHCLHGLRRNSLSTPDVQLIVYKQHLTQEEVMLDMDMNIVQVLWNPRTDESVCSEAFVKGHEDKVIECLHAYDEERMFFRYERMKNKLPEYRTVGEPEPPFVEPCNESSGLAGLNILRGKHCGSVPK